LIDDPIPKILDVVRKTHNILKYSPENGVTINHGGISVNILANKKEMSLTFERDYGIWPHDFNEFNPEKFVKKLFDELQLN